MNKFYEIALKANGFDNVAEILSVCEATPNMHEAVEILAGIYTPPILPDTYTDGSKDIWTKVWYTPILQQVQAVRTANKKKVVYYDNRIITGQRIQEDYDGTVDKSTVVFPDFDPRYGDDDRDYKEHVYIKLEEMEDVNKTFSLKMWER